MTKCQTFSLKLSRLNQFFKEFTTILIGAKMMKEWGWEITPTMEQAFQRIWIETDIDKDYSKRSFMENTNFFLGQWAWLINN